ncbi:hypothetical protein [Paenibacillus sp. YN15]|uniref:hypothetical protein n=1 Tax=Paenibacillus sp. YN15 TaxID=1742774 RepID=UPI000DCD47D7|nr:hypothetical protein [Paenibacillus sp. YN15]RAU94739.1 hypothetical protein DQG13_23490 [Paenibacillus sp. YN15]
MDMNPGYLSLVLISVTMILLASGWKDILLPGIPRAGILAFFVGWMIAALFSVELERAEIQFTLPYLLLCAAAATRSLKAPLLRAHVWVCGLLLGAFDCLLRELGGWAALAPQGHAWLNEAAVIAVITLLLGRGALWQWIALSVGLTVSEALFFWFHQETASVAGGAAFADHWWLLLCLTRGLSVLLEAAGKLAAKYLRQGTKR